MELHTLIKLKEIFTDIQNVDINILISEYQQFPWEYKCSNYPNGLPKLFTFHDKSMSLIFPETQKQLTDRCNFFLEHISNTLNNCAIITHGSLINYFASILKPRDTPYNIKFSGYIIVKHYKNGTINVEINENPFI